MKHFRGFLLFISMLLATIQPWMVALSATPPSAETAAGAQGEHHSISLEWSYTTDKESTWEGLEVVESDSEHASLYGSAIVTYDRMPSYTEPITNIQIVNFQLIVRYNMEHVDNGYCSHFVQRRSLANPAANSGNIDPLREGWNLDRPNLWPFQPYQHDDGSWYMKNLFTFMNYKRFSYVMREEDDSVTCNPASTYKTESILGYVLSPDIAYFAPELQGDADGKVFHIDKFAPVSPGSPIVHFRATVRLLDGQCAGHAGPVDASDSSISNMDVALDADKDTIPPNKPGTLKPPDPVTLTLRVTCEGVPVTNANVNIEVEAKGGGHNHNDASHPRPRGYLNDQQLTEEKPKIQVHTDKNGVATITFLPGRDTLTAERGIAGTYIVTAALDNERFKNRKATRAIQVKRTEFVKLPAGDNYVVVRGGGQRHHDASWGMPLTIDAIATLADVFQVAQEQHNQQLVAKGKKPWPVAELSINDISLQDGGLFDVTGFDIVRKKVVGQDWQPPHYSHRDGTGIDINSFRGNPHRTWLVATLRSLGNRYGKWEKREPSLHLEVKAKAQAVAAASSADPGVVAFLNRESDLPTAAPGQVVSYTVAVDNMDGTLDAGAVTLSSHLSAGLTFVSADPQPTGLNDQQPFWTLDALAAGALPETFEIVARVQPQIAPGSVLTVTAEANGTGADANQENNQDSFGLIVQQPGADLVVDSNLDSVAMTADHPVTVSLNVANWGNAVTPDTRLQLTIPPSVTVSSVDPAATTKEAGKLTWKLGDLAVDAERPITVVLDLTAAMPLLVSANPDEEASALLTYTLSASSAASDIDADNNRQQVAAPLTLAGSDLQLWLDAPAVDGPSALADGQAVTYTLTYANFGNQIASAATITMSLAPGLTLIAAQPSPNQSVVASASTGNVLTWNVGDLPEGAADVIQVQVRADSPAAGAPLSVTAQSSSWELDPLDNFAQGAIAEKPAVVVQTSLYLPMIQN